MIKIYITLIIFLLFFVINLSKKPFFPVLIYDELIGRATCEYDYLIFEPGGQSGWTKRRIRTNPELHIDDQESIKNVLNCINSTDFQKDKDRCMAVRYATGIGLGKSLHDAILNFDKAGLNGDTWSKKQSTYLKINISLSEKSISENTYNYLDKLCSTTSNPIIARLISSGLSAKGEKILSIKCEQKALSLGDSQSLCKRGKLLYEHSDRVSSASEIYFMWSKAVHLSNDPNCLANLGLLYEQGLWVEKDINVAMEIYKYAEKLGSKAGIRNRAYLLERGFFGEIDNLYIENLYRKSAELGDNFSIQKLRYREVKENIAR